MLGGSQAHGGGRRFQTFAFLSVLGFRCRQLAKGRAFSAEDVPARRPRPSDRGSPVLAGERGGTFPSRLAGRAVRPLARPWDAGVQLGDSLVSTSRGGTRRVGHTHSAASAVRPRVTAARRVVEGVSGAGLCFRARTRSPGVRLSPGPPCAPGEASAARRARGGRREPRGCVGRGRAGLC